jgi:hypothetical protein
MVRRPAAKWLERKFAAGVRKQKKEIEETRSRVAIIWNRKTATPER